MNGSWEEVIDLNQHIIDRFPRDAEAYNRLGRAYLELSRLTTAYDAYSSALKIDPANIIARRSLTRLDVLRRRPTSDETLEKTSHSPLPRTNVFIEEVGKTWRDALVNPADAGLLAGISSGEQLGLDVQDGRLVVKTLDGRRLGEIEAKTAERVIDLMNGGNRYEVFALGMSNKSLLVILREVHRAPALASTVSFPRQIAERRAYLRERELLRSRDEAEFMFFEDDDEVEEEETTPDPAEDDEAAEPDAEVFPDESPIVPEEEEPLI